MSSNIGPNSNNKITGRANNPFSSSAKTSTYTRPLGSTSIFAAGPGGWRGAARGANPYDTQSMNAARFARMRAGANVYAGRNIGSFGALAQQSGANDMSGLEKAMIYTQLGMMGVELAKGIADLFGTGKSDKTAPAQKADAAAVVTPANTQIPTATTISSENASLVSDMANAKDAASLHSAVQNAQAKLTEITNSMSGLEEAKNTAETRKQALDNKKNELLQEYRQAGFPFLYRRYVRR